MRLSPADEALRDAIRTVLQHGLLRRDGVVVGCWWVDGSWRVTPRGPDHDRLRCRAVTRTADGRVIGSAFDLPVGEPFDVAVAHSLADRETDPDVDGASFGPHLRKAMAMVDRTHGTARDGVDTMPSHVVLSLASRNLGREASGPVADTLVSEAVEALHGELRTFLATLDPGALDVLATRTFAAPTVGWREDGDVVDRMGVGRLGQVWPLLDATFGFGAPLQVALRRHPGLFDTLVSVARAARHDPAPFASDALGGRLADRIARRAHEQLRVPHRIGMALPALSEALEGDPARARDIRRALIERRGASEWTESPDVAVVLAKDLEPLPAEALPMDAGSWDALLDCHGVVWAAEFILGPWHGRIPSRLLNLGRGWPSFRRQVTDASRGVPLDDAAMDAIDLGRGYVDEVVQPAQAIVAGLAPGARLERWGMLHVAGSSLLYSGRSLTRILRTSAAWHRDRPAMLAAKASLPCLAVLAPSWAAGLPGHVSGELTLDVLTTEQALRDEGASGPDGEGMAGLAHCVGGYGNACRGGRTRIASVRRAMADGTRERVATAQFGILDGRVGLIQLRGARNVAPAEEVRAFVDAYLDLLRSGGLTFDPATILALTIGDTVAHVAGYDWTVPGNWEAVRDLWRPHVPRPLRDLSAADVVATWEARKARHGYPYWLPDPVEVVRAPPVAR